MCRSAAPETAFLTPLFKAAVMSYRSYNAPVAPETALLRRRVRTFQKARQSCITALPCLVKTRRKRLIPTDEWGEWFFVIKYADYVSTGILVYLGYIGAAVGVIARFARIIIAIAIKAIARDISGAL